MMVLELFLTDSLTIPSSETSSLVKFRGLLFGFSTYPSFYRESYFLSSMVRTTVNIPDRIYMDSKNMSSDTFVCGYGFNR